MAIQNPVTICFEDEAGNSVVERRLTNQRHNRYLTLSDGDTWPGDDTYSVTFAQTEDVRRYRVRVECGTAGEFLKIVEDAANEAQAEAWLADASTSSSSDVEYIRIFSANTTSATTERDTGWSEWQELSKNKNDTSLSRLDFLGSLNGAMAVWVEAE